MRKMKGWIKNAKSLAKMGLKLDPQNEELARLLRSLR